MSMASRQILLDLTEKIFFWFENNLMKTNSSEECIAIQIKNSTIKCSEVMNLLRIHIDYKFKFDGAAVYSYECIFTDQFNYYPVI